LIQPAARRESQLNGERVERGREENQFLKGELIRARQEMRELRRRMELIPGKMMAGCVTT
jgi:predicted RNase H-like nuclease (RuvC/YqgF family)